MEKKELLNALDVVKSAISSKDIIEGGDEFIFSKDKLIASNGKITIATPLTGIIEGDPISVASEEFFKIVQKAKGDNIDIEIVDDKDSKKLSIKSKKMKALLNITIEPDIIKNINEINIDADRKWNKLPDNFIDGVYKCMFAASKDITDNLSNICISDDVIVSSDDLRISIFKLDKKIRGSFLLPRSSAEHLVKFNAHKYSVDDELIFFKSIDDSIFVTVTSNLDYEQLESHFDFKGEIIKLPEKLKSMIESTKILASGKFDIDKVIKIKISNGKISCSANNEKGWIQETAKTKYSGNDITFLINPIFLLDIIDNVNSVKIGEDRALFEFDNFRHLVSLYSE